MNAIIITIALMVIIIIAVELRKSSLKVAGIELLDRKRCNKIVSSDKSIELILYGVKDAFHNFEDYEITTAIDNLIQSLKYNGKPIDKLVDYLMTDIKKIWKNKLLNVIKMSAYHKILYYSYIESNRSEETKVISLKRQA